MLDRMAREGRVDVELDEDRGVIFYVVRGLTPPPAHLAVRPIDYGAYYAQQTAPKGDKSVAIAAVLGLLFPGVGLLYAAPWTAALAVGLGTLVVVKMVAAIPLLGWLLSPAVMGVCALASGVLGAMYARKFNRAGKRTHLDLTATRTAGKSLVSPLREAHRVASS
jgi:hypothetical protein